MVSSRSGVYKVSQSVFCVFGDDDFQQQLAGRAYSTWRDASSTMALYWQKLEELDIHYDQSMAGSK